MNEEISDKKEEIEKMGDYVSEMSKRFTHRGVFAVEKYFKGDRVSIHKAGTSFKIYTGEEKELALKLSDVGKQILKLDENDFILDCQLKDDKIYLVDLLYYEDRDLTEDPWFERKRLLKKFKYSENIKEVPSIIVKDKKSADEAIEMFNNFSDSDGSIVKRYDSTYTFGEDGSWHATVKGGKSGKTNKDSDKHGSN